ncbi:protein cycle-like protein [Dinothrombium tinctorium]|uniref:Protein cycle-like protein n=1 Tax=Dinothrombium tinctorium TaxID=1965070 RepID=A0A3S3P7D5_9ACAR|nr:protein cycle-like protein [Dinothrombium tinctorium]RWS13780.1 protein cycle-like protein [Dinothrombium tinctorium]
MKPPLERRTTVHHNNNSLGMTMDCVRQNSSKSQEASSFEDSKKQNHSEIEKRRRDKMNRFIMDLSELIPMCGAMSRKLDKLTVLRMAVQYIKALKGSITNYTGGGQEKPSFLKNDLLNDLILKISDGFLFVVTCDRGKILFVSQSVSQILNYTQEELFGQNWFNILHPKDIAKVKEQLSSSDLLPKETFIDAKTMLPIKTRILPNSEWWVFPGAKRSFFCRMKCKSISYVKEETEQSTGRAHKKRRSNASERKYCTVHCTGFLRSFPSERLGFGRESESDIEPLNCLIAVGRIFSQFSNPTFKSNMDRRWTEFVSRHTKDGRFLFIDQKATFILGYLPQELLGTSFCEYCHPAEVIELGEQLKRVTENKIYNSFTRSCRFRVKNGSYINLQTTWRVFINPATGDFEYFIVINNYLDENVVEQCVNGSSKMLPNNSTIVTAQNEMYLREQIEFEKGSVLPEKSLNVKKGDAWKIEKNMESGVSKYTEQNETFPYFSDHSASNFEPNRAKIYFDHGSMFTTYDNGSNMNQDITSNSESISKPFADLVMANDGELLVTNFWSTSNNTPASSETSTLTSFTNENVNFYDTSFTSQFNNVYGKQSEIAPKSTCCAIEEADEETLSLIKSLLDSELGIEFNGVN